MDYDLPPSSDAAIAKQSFSATQSRWLWLLPIVCIVPAHVAQVLFLTGCRCGEHRDSVAFAFACNWFTIARSVLGIATGRASSDWPIYATIPFGIIPLTFGINALRFSLSIS